MPFIICEGMGESVRLVRLDDTGNAIFRLCGISQRNFDLTVTGVLNRES